MDDKIYRISVENANSKILHLVAYDRILNANINQYSKCYVMIERFLAISSNTTQNFVQLNISGLQDNIDNITTGVPSISGYVNTFKGDPFTKKDNTQCLVFDYNCYTQNWIEVNMYTLNDFTARTNFAGVGDDGYQALDNLNNPVSYTYYLTLKFKFIAP